MEAVRCFFAVEAPASLQEEIALRIPRWKSRILGVRWARPEAVHFTVKFMGSVEDVRIPDAVRIAASALKGVAPFSLDIEGAGVFPTPQRPRVFWLGTGAGAEPLKEIARRLEAALGEAGFKREERPFKPHLTVGRADGRLDADAAAAWGELADGLDDMVEVREVVLFRSDLEPGGARYTRMAGIPLR